MKGIAAPLALATLTTAVSAFPHARGSVFDNAVELEVRDYFQPVSHLERRQFGAGPPPPPPASLPYAYGLSNTYKAPATTGGRSWKAARDKAASIVSQMTNEEKLGLVSGQNGRCAGNTLAVERLGLPTLCALDGPAGPRFATGITQMPSELTTAATWDRALTYNRTLRMGHEWRELGVNIALAPVTGGPIGRSPLGGRFWEGAPADPYLCGEIAYASVMGLQASGVAATAKHYIAYEQETFRNPYGSAFLNSGFGVNEQLPIDSILDDQATHELYLWPFAEAVRAGTSYVMSSYNMINGTHASANSQSINLHLKTELGFMGAVMSDWGGVWSGDTTFNGGNDLDFPGDAIGGLLGSFFHDDLPGQFANGSVTQERLDDGCVRILTPYFQLGQDKNPFPAPVVSWLNQAPYFAEYKNVITQDALATARKIAEDGAILLKNDGALPINPNKSYRLGLFGADAGPNILGATACAGSGTGACPIGNDNGTVSMGGGSGWAFPNNLIDPLTAFRIRALSTASQIQAVLNSNATDVVALTAPMVDVAMVFVDSWATEGADRVDFDYYANGKAIIDATVANNNNTILVLFNPGPVDLADYANHPNVTAIIATGYPGEQTGLALAGLIYGDYSPSGKLPFTMGSSPSEYPANGGIMNVSTAAPKAEFTEGVYIDYKYFNQQGTKPVYPFGYGLSYSKFSYSGISLYNKYQADNAPQGTNEKWVGQQSGESIYDQIAEVSIEIQNVGKMTACEVAQMYIEFPASENQPKLQLRGFDKLKQLAAGASATAYFPIRRKDVMVWDTVKQMWRQPTDGYVNFHVGDSSANTPYKVTYKF